MIMAIVLTSSSLVAPSRIFNQLIQKQTNQKKKKTAWKDFQLYWKEQIANPIKRLILLVDARESRSKVVDVSVVTAYVDVQKWSALRLVLVSCDCFCMLMRKIFDCVAPWWHQPKKFEQVASDSPAIPDTGMGSLVQVPQPRSGIYLVPKPAIGQLNRA